ISEVSLTTAGIREVFVEFLLAVVHRDAALGQDVIEVQPAHAGKLCRLAQAQRVLRVKRHGQFQLEARFGLGGRDVQRLVDVVRKVERDAHGYFLHPFRRLVKPPAVEEQRRGWRMEDCSRSAATSSAASKSPLASPAMSMKVFGFNARILKQRRKDAEKILWRRNWCVLNRSYNDIRLVTLLHSL